ncbi:MAG TPA: gas vesicle protein [Candidatus Limnocylindrales bacterium]
MKAPTRAAAREILQTGDDSLLDLVDNLLTRGVVISGEVMLGLAGVDLVYLRLQAILCAADRVEDRRRTEREGRP